MFSSFATRASLSASPLIRHTFLSSSKLMFTPFGYNYMCKQNFVKEYFEDDYICADFVRNLRLNNIDLGRSSVEEVVYTVCCN